MKRALVTGGCGFIGSNLSKKLVSEGWIVDIVDDLSSGRLELVQELKIRVVPVDLLPQFYNNSSRDDETVHILQGDFSHENVLKNIIDQKYDCVFHQAAIPRVLFSVENPSHTTDVNISATVRLFEACKGNVSRVVFASSSSVYGGSDILPTHEAQRKYPKSPYAWQKSAIEDVSRIFANLYGLDVICLRYFNVFGPGQYGDSPYSTAVSSWCHCLVNGLPLRSDGNGTQSRDLCYIDNVVHANILAANSDKEFRGDCYNIACGDRTSNNEILKYFMDKFSHAVRHDASWRTGDVMHTQADIARAKEELGYEPLVRFWDGLEKTIEWWGLES
tara:strand:+ start:2404 stop:3399 length:996 start_codon:yes stop_codon:yes gene_type:complete